MLTIFFFAIIPWSVVKAQYFGSKLLEKVLDPSGDLDRDYSGFFQHESYPLDVTRMPPPQANLYQTYQPSYSTPPRRSLVQIPKYPSPKSFQRQFITGDRIHDFSSQEVLGFEEPTIFQQPKTNFRVSTVRTPRGPASGAEVASNFPVSAGGLPLSHLSFPDEAELNHPSLDIPYPKYPDQLHVFDPDYPISSSSRPDKLTVPNLSPHRYPLDSKCCASFSREKQKARLMRITCKKRTSCSNCTSDFKCIWCSSKNSCMPYKTHGFDSFTGQQCPASDIYYFNTCWTKSLTMKYILINSIIVGIILIIILVFLLIWRKYRKDRVYIPLSEKKEKEKYSPDRHPLNSLSIHSESIDSDSINADPNTFVAQQD